MAVKRIDRILSESGLYSRSEARGLIRAGRVTAGGAPVRSADEKHDDGGAICVDGRPLRAGGSRYYIMNKPAGYVCATEDRTERTVLELLPPGERRLGLFPVGRLDKETTGLLLLTNDGGFAHRVISPKNHVEKRYAARLDAPLPPDSEERFAAGVTLRDGTHCLPAVLERLDGGVVRITVCEGKYHQVRRMVAACGGHVQALHRESVGALHLPPGLEPGEIRELTAAEAALVFE